MGWLDELAAGDEVDAAVMELEQIQRQLESMGASKAPQPMGHITVPQDAPGLALPAGSTVIDFDTGVAKNEDLGEVASFLSIDDLTGEASPRAPTLQNVILHTDTLGSVTVGNEDQRVFFGDVPLPHSGFSKVQLNLELPGEVSVLASTQRLPIGLGAVTLNGSRYGELASGTHDDYQNVTVSPYPLWTDQQGTYANAAVYTAFYDTSTFRVTNTSAAANDIDVQVQAREGSVPEADWYEIATDPNLSQDDWTVFNVSERHKFLRVRVRNSTNGNTVAAQVDYTGANP